jgi:hypothetical protein
VRSRAEPHGQPRRLGAVSYIKADTCPVPSAAGHFRWVRNRSNGEAREHCRFARVPQRMTRTACSAISNLLPSDPRCCRFRQQEKLARWAKAAMLFQLDAEPAPSRLSLSPRRSGAVAYEWLATRIYLCHIRL